MLSCVLLFSYIYIIGTASCRSCIIRCTTWWSTAVALQMSTCFCIHGPVLRSSQSPNELRSRQQSIRRSMFSFPFSWYLYFLYSYILSKPHRVGFVGNAIRFAIHARFARSYAGPDHSPHQNSNREKAKPCTEPHSRQSHSTADQTGNLKTWTGKQKHRRGLAKKNSFPHWGIRLYAYILPFSSNYATTFFQRGHKKIKKFLRNVINYGKVWR